MPVAPMTAPKKTRRTLLTLTVPPPLYWSYPGGSPKRPNARMIRTRAMRRLLEPAGHVEDGVDPASLVVQGHVARRRSCRDPHKGQVRHHVSGARVEVGRNRLQIGRA